MNATARQIWIFVATSLGALMALIDVTIVNVALPTLQREMHVGFAALQWVVNAYTIPLAVLLLIAGRLGDVFGRRKLFAIGLGVFTIGSAVCALANVIAHLGVPPLAGLMVGRVIAGAGAAVLLPGSLSIVNETFHENETKRTTAVGGRGAMTGLGLVLGPLAGGVLLVHFSWTSIFLINVPVGIVTIVLTLWLVPESRDPNVPKDLDPFGAIVFAIAVLATVMGLVMLDAAKAPAPALQFGLFGIGALALALFVAHELRRKKPLYDLRLFANRSFSGAGGAVFLLSAAILGSLFFLTLYLQNVLKFSPLATGVALLPLTGVVFVVSPFAGRATSSVGPRALIATGMLCAAAGIGLLHWTPVDGTSPDWLVLIPSFLLVGLGMSLSNPPIVAVATGTVPHERSGLAAGINTVCRQIGTAFGIALIGAFVTLSYDRSVSAHLPPHQAQAVERRGTVQGSSALRSVPTLAPVGRVAQRSWMGAFHVAMTASSSLLLLGSVVAFVAIRKRDMPQTADS